MGGNGAGAGQDGVVRLSARYLIKYLLYGVLRRGGGSLRRACGEFSRAEQCRLCPNVCSGILTARTWRGGGAFSGGVSLFFYGGL